MTKKKINQFLKSAKATAENTDVSLIRKITLALNDGSATATA